MNSGTSRECVNDIPKPAMSQCTIRKTMRMTTTTRFVLYNAKLTGKVSRWSDVTGIMYLTGEA